MTKLAPIGISTYIRLEHLKQTISALQQNTLAKQSRLFVFSDAPKEGDEEKVREVREYLHTIDGFKKVHVIERKKNGRVTNNRGGIKQLLDQHGKVIWFEDDNITSEFFLEFVNESLNKYKGNKNIFGIGGFNTPMAFNQGSIDQYYLSHLFNGWGWATWSDRPVLEALENNNAYLELSDNVLRKKIRQIHPKLHKGLKEIYEGKLDAGDYKIVFYLIKNNMYMIKPFVSLVKNIGNDGSGVHCGVTDRFDLEIENKRIFFSNYTELKYCSDYDKSFYDYYHPKVRFFKKIFHKLNSIK